MSLTIKEFKEVIANVSDDAIIDVDGDPFNGFIVLILETDTPGANVLWEREIRNINMKPTFNQQCTALATATIVVVYFLLLKEFV